MATQVKLQQSKSEQTSNSGDQFLCLGFGMVAKCLAPHLLSQGISLAASVRSDDGVLYCQLNNITALPLQAPHYINLRRALQSANHILISAPPKPTLSREGHSDPYLSILESIQSPNLFPNIKWVGYLSATSVYGDRGGHYVFEDENLYPTTARGKARVLAELAWLETGLPVHIFRLAGIYGAGRNPLLRAQMPNAKIIVKPNHISSRIHVDDIVSALLASMDKPNPTQVYNLADDHPAAPHDVMRYAAKLLDLDLPEIRFDQAEMSDMARSFYQERRRTANDRLKAELGWKPQYPDYQTGLKALLANLE